MEITTEADVNLGHGLKQTNMWRSYTWYLLPKKISHWKNTIFFSILLVKCVLWSDQIWKNINIFHSCGAY